MKTVLNYIGLFFLVFAIHAANATEELKPPLLEPTLIEDPVLIEALERASEASDEPSIQNIGFWSRSGNGTTVSTAKEWYFSAHLTPSTYVPPQAIITNIDYYWSNNNLNGWDQYFLAYLILYRWGSWWVYGPTPSNSGTFGNLMSLGFEANKGVYFGYVVDTLYEGAPLYNPPTVSINSVSVTYNY